MLRALAAFCFLAAPGDSVTWTHVSKHQPQNLIEKIHHTVHALVLSDKQKTLLNTLDSTRAAAAVKNSVEFAKRYATPTGQGGKPLIVLTAADGMFTVPILNWMYTMEKHNITNYGVICLDHATRDLMNSIGRPCFGDESFLSALGAVEGWEDYQGRFWRFWAMRLHIASLLTEAGIDVVFTDADALWVKNPLSLVVQGDITASRGILPQTIRAEWGATACMGFIYFHGTPAVASFIKDKLLPQYYLNIDKPYDQAILNYALAENGITWSGKKMTYHGSNDISTGTVLGLQVNILDHDRFQRQCSYVKPDPKAYVLHCLVPREQIKKSKFWHIREDWEGKARPTNTSAPDAFHTYLDSITL